MSTAQHTRKESSGRLQALQGTKAALSGVQAVQAGRMDAAKGDDPSNNNSVGISLSYGSQSSKSVQHSGQSSAQGSSLTAGDNLTIRAREGDVNVTGSQLQAGKDVSLEAARDVNLVSAKNNEVLTGKNSSKRAASASALTLSRHQKTTGGTVCRLNVAARCKACRSPCSLSVFSPEKVRSASILPTFSPSTANSCSAWVPICVLEVT
ncbi:hemagglutinin repeat-containing protein [Serratia sp. JUb9]|nr:hemagglutinin repeat-containing protein [Serratia sp. JUb9]